MAFPSQPPVVAVLAGGRGERLGGDKACVMLADRPLVTYPLAAAHDAGLTAIVVAKPHSTLPPLQERVVHDLDVNHHPLSGVITALGESETVIAVACDMPFVTPAFLRWLAEQPAGAVVARQEGFLQPFPARYDRRDLDELTAAQEAQGSLRQVLALLRPQVVELDRLNALAAEPSRLFFSVNTPADLATAESWLGVDHRAQAARHSQTGRI
jgi:molybdenum cofactor guanylyltransferase